MNYLSSKNAYMSLNQLGISPALLAIELTILVVLLVFMFTFIFLGISAFSLGGTFGAIINGVMPICIYLVKIYI
jgi:hypothetical protein